MEASAHKAPDGCSVGKSKALATALVVPRHLPHKLISFELASGTTRLRLVSWGKRHDPTDRDVSGSSTTVAEDDINNGKCRRRCL
jgi:hypothetical protein